MNTQISMHRPAGGALRGCPVSRPSIQHRMCPVPAKCSTPAALSSRQAGSTSAADGPSTTGPAIDPCQASTSSTAASLQRRSILLSSALGVSLASLLQASPSLAYTDAPEGLRLHTDKLDGYSFLYPDDWTRVTSSGNDIFLRNPFEVNECLFVDASSPSSSRYESVEQLGTPEVVAASILDRYLTQEFMSTRIGIKREGSVLSATARKEDDGRTYYDIVIRMTSYASRRQLDASRQAVLRSYAKEWDRVLFTTLGVANLRLYELRLQAAADAYCSEDGVCGAAAAGPGSAAVGGNVASKYAAVQNSFRVRTVVV